jgi:hypothetical protein
MVTRKKRKSVKSRLEKAVESAIKSNAQKIEKHKKEKIAAPLVAIEQNKGASCLPSEAQNAADSEKIRARKARVERAKAAKAAKAAKKAARKKALKAKVAIELWKGFFWVLLTVWMTSLLNGQNITAILPTKKAVSGVGILPFISVICIVGCIALIPLCFKKAKAKSDFNANSIRG